MLHGQVKNNNSQEEKLYFGKAKTVLSGTRKYLLIFSDKIVESQKTLVLRMKFHESKNIADLTRRNVPTYASAH